MITTQGTIVGFLPLYITRVFLTSVSFLGEEVFDTGNKTDCFLGECNRSFPFYKKKRGLRINFLEENAEWRYTIHIESFR